MSLAFHEQFHDQPTNTTPNVRTEIADSIGRVIIAVPAKVLLHRFLAGSMRLLRHDFFVGHKGIFARTGRTKEFVEQMAGRCRGSDSAR